MKILEETQETAINAKKDLILNKNILNYYIKNWKE